MADEPIYCQPSDIIRRVPNVYLRQLAKSPVPSPAQNNDVVLGETLLRQQAYILYLETELGSLHQSGTAHALENGSRLGNPDVPNSPNQGTVNKGFPVVPPKTKRYMAKLQLEERSKELERKIEAFEAKNKYLEEQLELQKNKKNSQTSDCLCGQSLEPVKKNKKDDNTEHLLQTRMVENFERLVTELRVKYEGEISDRNRIISELERKNEELIESNILMKKLLMKMKTRMQELSLQKREFQHRFARLQHALHFKEHNLADTQSKLQNLVDWSEKLEHERDCIKGIARERARAETKLVQQNAADAAMVARLKVKLKQMYVK